ncbi:hypothetical protein [Candidatus Spongiihabitans sp.]|uniref:hypothetical protein n=1 Tax=Candidatus Spongiihabitans sp. TaxID=3101308 RepID=UPI003C7B8679
MPIICHCPAPIIIGRAIQWNMSSGVAGLLCFDAAPFDARMTARRCCLPLMYERVPAATPLRIPACRRE